MQPGLTGLARGSGHGFERSLQIWNHRILNAFKLKQIPYAPTRTQRNSRMTSGRIAVKVINHSPSGPREENPCIWDDL